MKIAIRPITQTFKLERLDPSGQTTVTIKQVTTGDLVRLGNLFSDQTQIWDDADYGTVKLKRKWNLEELKRERAYCTLVGADLEDSETDQPIFRVRNGKNGPELAMSRNEFIQAWDSLPFDVTEEIYEYILQVNPIWNPNAAGE